jgi:hypothetical protein
MYPKGRGNIAATGPYVMRHFSLSQFSGTLLRWRAVASRPLVILEAANCPYDIVGEMCAYPDP